MQNRPKIQLLSDVTINQIAAGEVIERASSVVKELVENSLDAGARSIEVEMYGGGLQLLRICDDGCGMSSQDALLSLERHATSKIRELSDLDGVATLGFRGEALASIASVAKVELTTCPDGEIAGTRIEMEGGRIVSHGPCGRAKGTTICVRSLFYNVPARRKFQKSSKHEIAEVHRLLSLIALAHPKVGFSLLNQGALLMEAPPCIEEEELKAFRTRLEPLFGPQRVAEMLPVDYRDSVLSLSGWIGKPSLHRPNRTGQYLFVGQRPVVSPLVSRAALEAYSTRLPNHRFPLFALRMELARGEVDVNVHPQKREVRFRCEEAVAEAVANALHQALSFQNRNHEILPPRPVQRSFPSPALYRESVPLPTREEPPHKPIEQLELIREEVPLPTAFVEGYLIYGSESLPEKIVEHLGAEPGSLILIELAAVRARIELERMEQQIEEGGVVGQQALLIPLTVELAPDEARRVELHIEELHALGMSIRSLGHGAFLMDALPVEADSGESRELLLEWLNLLEQHLGDPRAQQRKRMARAAARKGAKSKGFSIHQSRALISHWLRCKNPWEAPDGGATCIRLDAAALAARFGRS